VTILTAALLKIALKVKVVNTVCSVFSDSHYSGRLE